MKTVELRRHAEREKDADALSPEGRAHAETVGRTLAADYDVLFVSPAKRAAETLALFLRGSGQQLPSHGVVPGLLSEEEDRWRSAGKAAGTSRIDAIARQDPDLVQRESARLRGVVEELFERVPEEGNALGVGHTPLIEAAVYALTGVIVEPLSECEGVVLVQQGPGEFRLEERRSSR